MHFLNTNQFDRLFRSYVRQSSSGPRATRCRIKKQFRYKRSITWCPSVKCFGLFARTHITHTIGTIVPIRWIGSQDNPGNPIADSVFCIHPPVIMKRVLYFWQTT